MTPREELEMLRAQQGPLDNLPPPQASKARPPLPPMNVDPSEGMDEMDKLIVGFGAGIDKMARGIGGMLLPQGTEKWRKEGGENAELYKKYHPGGWATTGEVAADTAVSAIPVAKGGKYLTKALEYLPGIRHAAPILGDTLANAGYAAATAPEDRGGSAVSGALGSAGGRVLGKAVGKLGQPVETTPITQMMLDEGVPLTPGQASKGWLPKALEGGLYNTPFMPGVRRSVGNAQRAGQKGAEQFLGVAEDVAANPAAHGISPGQAEEWIAGARNINDTGMSTVPLTAIAAFLHLPTGGPLWASTSALYGTPVGRKFLLGQMPFQEALRQAPDLAPHLQAVGRAMSTQEQPPQE